MFKKLSEIAEHLGGILEGEDISVDGISGSDDALESYLTFMESEKYRSSVEASKAAAVIIPITSKGFDKPVIRMKNPRLGFALVLDLFHKRERPTPSVHSSAIIGKNVSLGKDVFIGPYVVIEDGASIGDRTEIYSFSYIGKGVSIGEDTVLEPRVTVFYGCSVGDRCLVHSGAVIGADGFGFVRDGAKQIKIPQVGIVSIGDDVEIGANTTIDRATTGKTLIGTGTKIDNIVQIGHNTQVGNDCTIVSQSGVAGSTKIGDRVIIAAQAGVRDHTLIGSDSIVAGRAGVTKQVKSGTIVSGYPAREHREELKIEASISKLPEFMSKMEKTISKISEGLNK